MEESQEFAKVGILNAEVDLIIAGIVNYNDVSNERYMWKSPATFEQITTDLLKNYKNAIKV